MQITRQDREPPTWEFHDASREDRDALGRFMRRWDHGTVVNPWEPFWISFSDPRVIEAFEHEYQQHFERA